FQIFQPLELTEKNPFGHFSSLTPTEIKGVFNRNIIKNTGVITIYKDNVLFATFNESEITVSNNEFTIDIFGLLVDNADYYINISSRLFTSILGEVHQGINNDTDWTFTLQD
ncbi:hypothetical protein, partial [Staphylococcus aureus]